VTRRAPPSPPSPSRPSSLAPQNFIFLLTSNYRRFTLDDEILLHDQAVNAITPSCIRTLKKALQKESERGSIT
jgi:hypothetical protein